MKLPVELRLIAVFLTALLALAVNAFLSNRNTNLLIESKDIVAHTLEVRLQSQAILSTLKDAETGQRGFLITGKDLYLAPYNDALQHLDSELTNLERLTKGNKVLEGFVPELRQAVTERVAYLKEVIEMRRQQGMAAITEPLMARGKERMDVVRQIVGKMDAEEETLLTKRRHQAEASEKQTRFSFYLATLAAVAVVCLAFYLVHRLIRERSHSEQEMRIVNEGLERRVAERTAALQQTNGRLAEANQELEAVSHDLRAPLRHISGFVDLLQKREADNLSEGGRRYLTTITDSARHAGNLVDDLLAFSRMGRAEMRLSTVMMESLIADVRRDLQTETEGRDIHWTVGTLPLVQGDPTMLRLIWQNLLGNAVKYSQGRSPATIEIGCESDEHEHRFFVRDNGVGFDMKYIDKLFGVFQRLHSKEQFEGTGIGLANVRRIVHRHGGRTWAEGELNKGATFWFTLPVVAIPQEREQRGLETHSVG